MLSNYTLMLGDTEVLEFNLKESYFKILAANLLPFGLRGNLVNVLDKNLSCVDAVLSNTRHIQTWLANRVLNLSRANAKKIYNALSIDQVEDDHTRTKIAIMCNAVSVLDNYWIRLKYGPQCWRDVNIRHNSLNDTIAQIALHGTAITVQGSLTTPELTTDGMYPKAWRRHADGSLWLYKADYSTEGKALTEVTVSKLLDKMNVQHAYYEQCEEGGKQLCRCKILTDDNHSLLPAYYYALHCKHNNLPFVQHVMQLDKDSINKMCIVDYLISNSDRHSKNWGFLYNPTSMVLIGCHPLFDHNNAFDPACMNNRDAIYTFNKRSMRDTAKLAMEDTDFHFTEEITRDDFQTDNQYNEFMWRANDLGITIKNTYRDRIIKFLQETQQPRHINEVSKLLPDFPADIDMLRNLISLIYDM